MIALLKNLTAIFLLSASVAALPVIIAQEPVFVVNLVKLPWLAASMLSALVIATLQPRRIVETFRLPFLLLLGLLCTPVAFALSRGQALNLPLIYIVLWPCVFYVMTRLSGLLLNDCGRWFFFALLVYVVYYTAQFGLVPDRDQFAQSIFAGVLGQLGYVFLQSAKRENLSAFRRTVQLGVSLYDLFVSGSRRFFVVFLFGFIRPRFLILTGAVLVIGVYLADAFLELPSAREESLIRSVGYRTAEFALAFEELARCNVAVGCGVATDVFVVVLGSKGEIEFQGYFHNFYLTILRAFGISGLLVYGYWIVALVLSVKKAGSNRALSVLAGTAFGAALSLFFDMPRDGPWVLGFLLGLLANELEVTRSTAAEGVDSNIHRSPPHVPDAVVR